ncbi:MAG: undecaprenyl-diphosphatase UppP [Candidatus Kapaibacterium sp.]
MNIIEAIILGIIQGLTEFIPISSTAHLTIAGKIMGLISEDNPERWTSFIAMIQLGTLAAVFVYFKREIVSIPFSFIKENFSAERKSFSNQSLDSRLGMMIIAGTIPIVIVGLMFKDFIEGSFTKELSVIASSLIVLGVILFVAEKSASFKKDMQKISLFDSIMVGMAQCVALIPGSSRSGTTITAGLFLGMDRETSARFSFLLSIPAILASGLLGVKESLDYLSPDDALNIIIATVVSGISGYWAIHFLINFLKKNSTYLFIAYRIALGLIIFILLMMNVL